MRAAAWGLAVAALLSAGTVRAEVPTAEGNAKAAVEAAAANLSLFIPPPRDAGAEMTLKDRRGRARQTANHRAGVPGARVTVLFPAGSAELDDGQKHALHMLTRLWRDDPGVVMLWMRAGGEGKLARKRAEVLRRATGGKGFPWDHIWLDPVWACTGADCDRQGVVTVIERR